MRPSGRESAAAMTLTRPGLDALRPEEPPETMVETVAPRDRKIPALKALKKMMAWFCFVRAMAPATTASAVWAGEKESCGILSIVKSFEAP